MDEITDSKYWKEVQSIIDSVYDEVEQHGGNGYNLASQMVENHEWIVYYKYAYDILKCSDNEDVISDLGYDLNVMHEQKGLDGMLNTIAYYALLADVCQDMLLGIE